MSIAHVLGLAGPNGYTSSIGFAIGAAWFTGVAVKQAIDRRYDATFALAVVLGLLCTISLVNS